MMKTMKKYTSFIARSGAIITLTCGIGLFLLACANPFAGPAMGSSTVRLQFGMVEGLQSRTLLPDFNALISQVDRLDLELTSQSGFAARTLSLQPGTNMQIVDLSWGNWDIRARAYQGAKLVASANLPNQNISVSTTIINLDLAPLSSGNGSLDFRFQFATSENIDYVGATLLANDGSTVMRPETSVVLAPAGSGKTGGSYSVASLASGSYTLRLNFKRGGASGSSGGIFQEAVNIWGGIVTNRWVDPADNSIKTVRDFPVGSFFSQNTNLAELTIFENPNVETDVNNPNTNQNLGNFSREANIQIRAVGSIIGQSLAYALNGVAFTPLVNNTYSAEITLKPDENTLQIRVTAPDGSRSTIYSYTLRWLPSTVSSSKMAMVSVQGGTMNLGIGQYRAGTPNLRYRTPVHEVTVSDFWIGKYEVTQAQWENVAGARTFPFDHDQKPAHSISYTDALTFCNILSLQEGLEPAYPLNPDNFSVPDLSKNGYRLPTDAEWEYAARGGHLGGAGQAFIYAGSNNADDVAVYNVAGPMPVGSKAPNQLGLYDMSGNVLEMTADIINCVSNDQDPQSYDFGPSYDPLVTKRDYVVHTLYENVASRMTSNLAASGYDPIHNAGAIYNAWQHSTMGGAFNVTPTILQDISIGGRLGVGFDNEVTIGFRVARSNRSLVRMVDIPAGTEASTGLAVRAFQMGATEVTQGQFERVMGYVNKAWDANGNELTNPDTPARSISFYDALVFCNKLSAREGLEPVYRINILAGGDSTSISNATYSADFSRNGYRLPMKSERIWATRGGRTTTYSWGDTLADYGPYEWTSANSTGKFQPMAQKLPNGYGLYDMGGNVHEWIWGSDAALALPSRAGGTSIAAPTDFYIAPTAMHQTGPGAGSGYYDNGFRVARNKSSTPTLTKNLLRCDFESLTLNSLTGQDGWTNTEYNGGLMIVTNSGLLPNTSKIAYNPYSTGPGTGASSSKPHGVNFQANKKYRFVMDTYLNIHGNTIALAYDANDNSKIARDESNEAAIAVSGIGNQITILLPYTPTARNFAIDGYAFDQWVRCTVIIDCANNTISLYSQNLSIPNSPTLRLMNGETLGISTNDDRTNPANWDFLYLHFEHRGMADNILIEEILE